MSETSRSYEILIRTSPERLWQALTDGEVTQKYYFNSRAESDWQPGSKVVYRNAQGGVDLEGEVLEAEPGKRLVTTFRPTWAPEVQGAAPSRLTWEIEPMGEACKLTLTHSGFDQASFDAGNMHMGWVMTVSSLKSLLETGQALNLFG